jgi:hypothetical protein
MTRTADMTAAELASLPAKEYAMLCNAERVAQAEAEGWGFYTLHPTDDAFWVEQAANGVVTAADLLRCQAIEAYSDSYKEIHNIRPRWVNYDDLTTEAIASMTDALYADRDAEKAEDEAKVAKAMDETPLTHNPFAALRK